AARRGERQGGRDQHRRVGARPVRGGRERPRLRPAPRWRHPEGDPRRQGGGVGAERRRHGHRRRDHAAGRGVHREARRHRPGRHGSTARLHGPGRARHRGDARVGGRGHGPRRRPRGPAGPPGRRAGGGRPDRARPRRPRAGAGRGARARGVRGGRGAGRVGRVRPGGGLVVRRGDRPGRGVDHPAGGGDAHL
ncbi:MAG: Isoleucyl-tRNA synthetase, partial [uncultured Pseudonocardia sp.]